MITLVTLSLFMPPAVSAEMEDHQLYRIGDEACTKGLDGAGLEVFADAVGGDPSRFCACVGAQFVENADLQTFRMDMADNEDDVAAVFVEILRENMSVCLPSLLDDEDFIDGDLVGVEGYEENGADGSQDGPDWSSMPDQAHCEFAIEGLLEPDDFDRAYVQDWISDSGIGAEDLCFCAAAIMEDFADEYATEFEATKNPDLYWDYMRRAVDQCQTAMWKR